MAEALDMSVRDYGIDLVHQVPPAYQNPLSDLCDVRLLLEAYAYED